MEVDYVHSLLQLVDIPTVQWSDKSLHYLYNIADETFNRLHQISQSKFGEYEIRRLYGQTPLAVELEKAYISGGIHQVALLLNAAMVSLLENAIANARARNDNTVLVQDVDMSTREILGSGLRLSSSNE